MEPLSIGKDPRRKIGYPIGCPLEEQVQPRARGNPAHATAAEHAAEDGKDDPAFGR